MHSRPEINSAINAGKSLDWSKKREWYERNEISPHFCGRPIFFSLNREWGLEMSALSIRCLSQKNFNPHSTQPRVYAINTMHINMPTVGSRLNPCISPDSLILMHKKCHVYPKCSGQVFHSAEMKFEDGIERRDQSASTAKKKNPET